MIKTLYVLDRNKNIIGFISNGSATPFFNDKFTQILASGAETFEFDVVADDKTNRLLIEGNYIMFEYNGSFKMFQIMTIEDNDSSYRVIKSCYCEIVGLELLNSYVRPCTIQGDIVTFFKTLLKDSNWQLGRYSSSLVNISKSIDITESKSIYTLIQENISTYNNIEIEFRIEFDNNKVTGYYIDVYEDGGRGAVTHKRFEHGTNVTGITRKGDITGFYSALIGEGKDGINFKDIEWKKINGDPLNKPKGQDFLLDEEAHKMFNLEGKYITGLYKCDDTNPHDLIQSTYNKLQEVKKVKYSYEVEVGMKLEEFEQIGMGDTVYVIDNNFNPPILLEARVSELEISFSDYRNNKCTLSNYKEVKSKIKSLSKEDIMNEVLDYLAKLEIGILTEADMKILRDYMEKMNFTKEEIDLLFSKYKDVMNGIDLEGSVINVTLENKRYYKCNVLDKLNLNVTNTTDSNFKSIIEFRTGYDCYPMKLFQTNDVWMVGEDCRNGVLINKADTKYRITVTYINNAEYPRKFKGEVEILSRGTGEYLVYPKFSKSAEMINLSLQYYNNRNLFKYNQLTPLSYYVQGRKPSDYADKWKTDNLYHIDCSTFTNSLYRARGYNNSIYKNLDYGMGASKKYGWGFDIGRTASDQAKWCIENGYQLDISTTDETAWWNLQPGDLVFWSARSETSETNVEGRYMQVGHVAIVRTPKTSSGTTTTMEVSTTGNVVLNRTLQINFPEKILFFARVRR